MYPRPRRPCLTRESFNDVLTFNWQRLELFDHFLNNDFGQLFFLTIDFGKLFLSVLWQLDDDDDDDDYDDDYDDDVDDGGDDDDNDNDDDDDDNDKNDIYCVDEDHNNDVGYLVLWHIP